MYYYSLLWVALAYNAFVYLRVHRLMHSALTANAVVAEPHATHATYRRLEMLGGRFALYLLTFLVSQLPCVLRHALVATLGPPSGWSASYAWAWDGVALASDALCPLHGFLNGLVYGLSNRPIYAHWCGPRDEWPAADPEGVRHSWLGGGGGGGGMGGCCWPWRGRRVEPPGDGTGNSADGDARASCTMPLRS